MFSLGEYFCECFGQGQSLIDSCAMPNEHISEGELL